MSATGRGSERLERDSYLTPSWCARRLFEAWAPLKREANARIVTLLEPCVGDEGRITKAARAHYGALSSSAPGKPPDAGLLIEGWDILETLPPPRELGCNLQIAGRDALGSELEWPQRDIIATNPPFSLAVPLLTRALKAASHVAFLLPLPWLSGGRRELLSRCMPHVRVLPERPSFVRSYHCRVSQGADGYSVGCGWSGHGAPTGPRIAECPTCGSTSLSCSSSDATEYAWFTWGPQRSTVGSVSYLASTPLEERKAG